ncbi:MAG: DUF2321 domain-containing protein [Bacillota bacterium]|nr:DUF2321 domain-containing protein [Bacillota bacterium]
MREETGFEMSHFFVRACPNGHYEIDYMRAKAGHTCRECGQPLIDACPECGRIIKDWNFYGSSMIPPKASDFVLEDNCPGCGKPYPWNGKPKRRVGNKQLR